MNHDTPIAYHRRGARDRVGGLSAGSNATVSVVADRAATERHGKHFHPANAAVQPVSEPASYWQHCDELLLRCATGNRGWRELRGAGRAVHGSGHPPCAVLPATG